MAKDKMLKNRNEDNFDFSGFMNSDEEDAALAGVMNGMIEASNNQMTLAIELTKLIVNKSNKDMSANEVFSIFKKASEVVSDTVPLKALWEQFSTTN